MKLVQVRDLMEKEGMHDSLNVFKRTFGGDRNGMDPEESAIKVKKAKMLAQPSKDKQKKSLGEQTIITSVNPVTLNRGFNKNGNRGLNLEKFLEQARSEITVYQQAVRKRVSSSSEDGIGLDSSGDSLNSTIKEIDITDKEGSRKSVEKGDPEPFS